jgi:hypothetical protein
VNTCKIKRALDIETAHYFKVETASALAQHVMPPPPLPTTKDYTHIILLGTVSETTNSSTVTLSDCI